MKLLLDENLSRRIVPFLQNAYPGSTQVVLTGMERASDAAVWEYAKTNSFVIVTKDSDYYDMSLLHGAAARDLGESGERFQSQNHRPLDKPPRNDRKNVVRR